MKDSPLMTSLNRSDSLATDRSLLRANCSDCFALCCTAFGFQRSESFPIDKPAGDPCRNLAEDFSCAIHEILPSRGFHGCAVFDCFGAGQHVSQNLFGGTSWRETPDRKTEMFHAFSVVRQLHEMLWYLAEAGSRATTEDSAEQAEHLRHAILQILDGARSELLAFDVERMRTEVRRVLIDVSEEARGGFSAGGSGDATGEVHPSADLAGRDLRSRRLCGTDLRGAYLIAADLRGCDLSGVDLLGADLRDARLEGADLSNALFLTQMQVNAARGDDSTLLPGDIDRPQHWLHP